MVLLMGIPEEYPSPSHGDREGMGIAFRKDSGNFVDRELIYTRKSKGNIPKRKSNFKQEMRSFYHSLISLLYTKFSSYISSFASAFYLLNGLSRGVRA